MSSHRAATGPALNIMASGFAFYSRITVTTYTDDDSFTDDHWVGHHKPTTVAELKTHETKLLKTRRVIGDLNLTLDDRFGAPDVAINCRW